MNLYPKSLEVCESVSKRSKRHGASRGVSSAKEWLITPSINHMYSLNPQCTGKKNRGMAVGNWYLGGKGDKRKLKMKGHFQTGIYVHKETINKQ